MKLGIPDSFWNRERIEVLPKAARDWVRKARAPNYDAPPLPTASEASGNELPTYLLTPYLPPSLPKKFLWFLWKFTEMKFR